MSTMRIFGTLAMVGVVAGCANTPVKSPGAAPPPPASQADAGPDLGLPERVDDAALDSGGRAAPILSTDSFADSGAINTPVSVDIGAAPTIRSVPVPTIPQALPQQTYAVAPVYAEALRPLRRGEMAPVRDDPLDGSAFTSSATTYNVAALKAAYLPTEARHIPAAPPTVRNDPSPEFGSRLSNAALARLNPNVAYVATYRKIGYPWGDVPENTGVCTDVVIRSYRGLGIDLQSMVHEDMRRAFVAYPSRKIYGLTEADPNIDHRRVVNLEAFFERVGASIPVGSEPQPGDLITWRLSGGEPHIGVVVDRRDPKTGNRLVVHNLGGGVTAEDLLDYAPPHGHYRFAPDRQSRMASLALRRG